MPSYAPAPSVAIPPPTGSMPAAGRPANTGPGGAQRLCPATALTDAAVGQWGTAPSSVSLTTRFQPTQEGASSVTPGTFNTQQVINPLQQIATQVNNESVLGIILAAAAVVILIRLVHH
jgi:hypothetical protein